MNSKSDLCNRTKKFSKIYNATHNAIDLKNDRVSVYLGQVW